ncbi:MAG TPA: hypothetical protein DCL44_07340 [Elusimicrobia bacterium]|nr:hypothetical protein [Elusimicrobiota bacterium]
MKKPALLLVFITSTGCLLCAGSFNLGMTGAAKKKIKELDAKVAARQSASARAPAQDTTPPVISGIQATNIFLTSATILWQTNEPARGYLDYGTSPGYGSSATLTTAFMTSHSVILNSLMTDTTYHYRITSVDSSSNSAISSDRTFATMTGDITPPVISNIAISVFLTSATVSWHTNELATGLVEYGTSTVYGSSTTYVPAVNSSHQRLLSILPNRTFHYRIKSADQWSNLSISSDSSFTVAVSSIIFTHSIVELSTITYIEPLGHMEPPGHTLPTEHIYFYINTSSPPAYAPAAGVIRRLGIVAQEQTYNIVLYFTDTFYVNIGHISALDPAIAAQVGYIIDPNVYNEVNIPVTGGQVLGQQWDMTGVEIGLVNYGVSTNYINPSRYADKFSFCDSIFKYYAEPLRSQLYALVPRTGTDKDGRVDYDIPGRLIGNWFLEGSGNPADDDAKLAIVYDNFISTKIFVSVGGTLSIGAGKYAVTGNSPDPATVSQDSNKVSYELTDYGLPYTPRGILLVQLVETHKIKIETFPGSTGPEEFTSNAKYYIR